MRISIYIYIPMYTYIHLYKYIYIYIHTYICVHIYTNMCVDTCICHLYIHTHKFDISVFLVKKTLYIYIVNKSNAITITIVFVSIWHTFKWLKIIQVYICFMFPCFWRKQTYWEKATLCRTEDASSFWTGSAFDFFLLWRWNSICKRN